MQTLKQQQQQQTAQNMRTFLTATAAAAAATAATATAATPSLPTTTATATTTTSLTILMYAVMLIAQPQSSLMLHASDDDGCNEFVCGSVVSKCLLTQSCQCKLTDCYCCRECLSCLGDLYTECCSCLDMCPKHNATFSALAPKSQIGDFDGVPELFETLTAMDDDDQWTVMRFPMRANLKRRFDVPGSTSAAAGDALDRQAIRQKVPALNCTVTYLNACTTNKKCAQYCESMGANSYRWFHDGCCECVGANCFNYGINESRCLSCPDDEDEDDADADDGGDFGAAVANDDMWDYGEEEINYN